MDHTCIRTPQPFTSTSQYFLGEGDQRTLHMPRVGWGHDDDDEHGVDFVDQFSPGADRLMLSSPKDRSPPPQRRQPRKRVIPTTNKSRHRVAQKLQGFRRDYLIGEALRSPSHMSPRSSSGAIASLNKHDFAFVKRSDGSFSYGIVARRIDESLFFVISGVGHTKLVEKRHWRTCIRLVSPGVPSMLSFVPQLADEEFSLITN